MHVGVMTKRRILVVEDDDRTAAALVLYLQHGGYEVVVAPTGLAALEEAVRFRPDLLVLDVMLPGLDGLEVCRTLRGRSGVPGVR